MKTVKRKDLEGMLEVTIRDFRGEKVVPPIKVKVGDLVEIPNPRSGHYYMHLVIE